MGRERRLELADIQGNILRGYNLPHAHYHFFHFADPAAGRRFLDLLAPRVTTADDRHHEGRWSVAKPDSTLNVALTYAGLAALDVPASALEGFSPAFRQGMRARARFLVDRGPSAPEHWEAPWEPGVVHACVTIYGTDHEAARGADTWLEERRGAAGDGVRSLGTQEAAALVVQGETTAQEHFGYADGFGNPDVEGSGAPHTPGRGKLDRKRGWVPLAPGEFILGEVDEAGEVAATPPPKNLFRNGTYMVFRKLHQNVGSFRRFLSEEGARYPGGEELFKAKLVGRWTDGTPLARSPHGPDPALAGDAARNTDFAYAEDPDGRKCPLGSHIRRANPRDAQGFDGVLANRHRIVRRGVPYGTWTPLEEPGDDDGDHGLIFVAYQADIERQFEFVQQQWLNYGNDALVGNDKDALVGSHLEHERMLVTGDGREGARPVHIVTGLRPFVVTRGGEYFFVPSVTALHMLANSLDRQLVMLRPPGSHRRPPHSDPPPGSTPMPHRSLLEKLAGLVHKVEGGIEHEISHLVGDIKAWLAHADPEPLFRVLRPIAPIVHLGDMTLVLRHADVLEVLAHDDVFAVPYGEKFRALTDGGEFFLGMPNDARYERDHALMRLAVRRDDIDTVVAPIVARAADEILSGSGGRIDVVQGLAAAVPTRLCGEYFGTPSPPDGSFAPWSAAISAFVFLPKGADEDAAMEGAKAMRAVIREQIEARGSRRGERDDVLERLLAMRDAGLPGVDDGWILDNLFSFVVAAIPTTAGAIAHAVDELLKRPRELEAAKLAAEQGDTELVGRYANECLRFNPLGPGVMRIATREYRLAKDSHHAKTIEPGTPVMAALLSAMFDERRIDDPNEFRVDRPDYDYLHYGYGLHTCFGRYINAVQIPLVIGELLERPNLRRAEGDAGKLQFQGAFPTSMTVEFDA